MINGTKILSHFSLYIYINNLCLTCEFRMNVRFHLHSSFAANFQIQEDIKYKACSVRSAQLSMWLFWQQQKYWICEESLTTAYESHYSAILHLTSVNWSKPLTSTFVCFLSKPVIDLQISFWHFIALIWFLASCNLIIYSHVCPLSHFCNVNTIFKKYGKNLKINNKFFFINLIVK